MKLKLSLFSIMVVVTSYGQRIKFSYDVAGNQIQRTVCLCAARESNDSIYKTPETLTDKDLIDDLGDEKVSYYPNPVRNELYIKWKSTENDYVSSIELYSITGQTIKSYSNLQNTDMANIAFGDYPEGFYNLVLVYSNGEKKTLKIVKK